MGLHIRPAILRITAWPDACCQTNGLEQLGMRVDLNELTVNGQNQLPRIYLELLLKIELTSKEMGPKGAGNRRPMGSLRRRLSDTCSQLKAISCEAGSPRACA